MAAAAKFVNVYHTGEETCLNNKIEKINIEALEATSDLDVLKRGLQQCKSEQN